MSAQTKSPARARQVSLAVVFVVTWLMTWLWLGCFQDFGSYVSHDGAETWHTLKRASWSNRLLYSFGLSGVFSLIHMKLVAIGARLAPVLDRIAEQIMRLF